MARLIVLAIYAYFLSFIVGPLIVEPIMSLFGFTRFRLRGELGIDSDAFDLAYRAFLVVMTWVVISYAYIPLGFIRPRVAQFTDTKLFRHLQTVFFYVMCVGLVIAILVAILNALPAERQEEINDFVMQSNEDAIGIFLVILGVVLVIAAPMVMGIVLAFFQSPLFPPIIRFLDQMRMGYGGAGRFTGLAEEMRNNHDTAKDKGHTIFFGRSLFWFRLRIAMKDDRHMLTIAGSRGGKGVSSIIPNLLLWKGSAIVIDPKGTNAEVTARMRSSRLNQSVYVIDPFGITTLSDKGSGYDGIGFNALSELNIKGLDAMERVKLIADALVMTTGKERDPHWDEMAREIIAGYIVQLMTDPRYEDRRNLPELANMIHLTGEARNNLLADMSINDAAGKLASKAANRIIGMGDSNELKSILSSVEKHTSWLSSEALSTCLKKDSPFKFKDMKDSATTVYLVIPPQYLKTHARFLRLFVNLTISGFVDGGKARIPTLLMMDEFLSLGHMAEVENAMSWTAGYNLFLWPFIQDFGSFKEIYGDKVNAFLGNTRAVQVFAVDDEVTNKFVSERLGKKPLTARIDIRRANETLPIREPSEVPIDISAESGRQYILQAGKPTMLLERMPYYKSWMFKDFDRDPDHAQARAHPLTMLW